MESSRQEEIEATVSPSGSNHGRITKRKLDEALSLLDTSLQATLQSVKRNKRKQDRPTSTAKLESLLPSRLPPPVVVPPPSTYVPLSLTHLITRIKSYRLATYSLPKPPSLSPATLALYGWENKGPGRERVQCVTCNQGVIISPPTQGGWNTPTGVKLQQEYDKLVGPQGRGHDMTCPWRMRGCSRSLYRVQVTGRKKLIDEVRCGAASLDAQVTGSVLITTTSARDFDGDQSAAVIKALRQGEPNTPSDTALLLSLFGWTVPNGSSSSSISSSPTLVCPMCNRQVLLSPFISDPNGAVEPAQAAKSFDLASQHHSFCPFVDPSAGLSLTTTPTSTTTPAPLPSFNSRAGWRLRVDILLQNGGLSGRRQSSSESLLALIHGSTSNGDSSDGAVISSATPSQRKGGLAQSRELLSYVRSLLGPKRGK